MDPPENEPEPTLEPLSSSRASLEPERSNPQPPGFWLTIALGAAIFFAFLTGQSLPVIGAIAWQYVSVEGFEGDPMKIAMDGDVLALSTFGGGLFGLLLVGILIRAIGWRIPSFLALHRFSWWHLPLWLVVTYGAALLHTWAAPHFSKDEIPEFMVDAYQSTDSMLLLALAIAGMAPLFEEVFFRGFLFTGWQHTWLKIAGTAILTSFLWTIIHVQYGWFELSWIFLLGLLLGLARHLSRSLWIPIAMHVFNNALSLVITHAELS
ncbi:MAG: CPBP family intramembrane glutamic endopeptidase [Verrucomicrobiota bacterium]